MITLFLHTSDVMHVISHIKHPLKQMDISQYIELQKIKAH